MTLGSHMTVYGIQVLIGLNVCHVLASEFIYSQLIRQVKPSVTIFVATTYMAVPLDFKACIGFGRSEFVWETESFKIGLHLEYLCNKLFSDFSNHCMYVVLSISMVVSCGVYNKVV